MDKNNVKVAGNGQGPDFSKLEVPSIAKVREMLKRDLGIALNVLDAVYSDENTLNACADYLHGRMLNEKNRDLLKKQTKIDFDGEDN